MQRAEVSRGYGRKPGGITGGNASSGGKHARSSGKRWGSEWRRRIVGATVELGPDFGRATGCDDPVRGKGDALAGRIWADARLGGGVEPVGDRAGGAAGSGAAGGEGGSGGGGRKFRTAGDGSGEPEPACGDAGDSVRMWR